MQSIPKTVLRTLSLLKDRAGNAEMAQLLQGSEIVPSSRRLRMRQITDEKAVAGIWERFRDERDIAPEHERAIADRDSVRNAPSYGRNIENFIGTAKVPMGLIGPLRVNGLHAQGNYYVPLATTEAALVASYGRGADIITKAKGVSTAMIADSQLRAPAFVFADMLEAGLFVNWVADHVAILKAAAEATSEHGRLMAIEPVIDSNTVFLLCRYTTGDAAGQNMVTMATQALCSAILENCPIDPTHWFIEANFSGDKKASYLGMQAGRGRKVTACIEIPNDIIRKYLHAEPEKLLAYSRVAGLGAVLSGQFGVQGHYANALAAFYIATGQDAACVAESAVGYTRVEPKENGIFFSVTLPNILVGSLGGGTGLPTQAAALAILGLAGPGKAAALAEVTAALCLCGEISIVGAMAAGHFTRAHEKLARARSATKVA